MDLAQFGTWLKQRREGLDLTQRELADAAGCSVSTIRKMESGLRRPSKQVAELLAECLEVTPEEHSFFMHFARSQEREKVRTSPLPPLLLPQTPASSLPALPGQHEPAAEAAQPPKQPYALIPVPLTNLLGREQILEQIREQLLQPDVRLITLIGPPGVGKTRLGLQVASDLRAHFEGGIFFVDLSPIVDPDLVLPTIAHTLKLKEAGNQSVDSVLTDYIHDRRMLLFLDNFEQVLDAAPRLAKLLEANPLLKVLVSSREALHIRGERRIPVSPLVLPDIQQLPPPSVLATYPAIALFIERAKSVDPDFELTEENAEDVVAVCVGLEGLPLAIELAAARARHFSPSEMRSALRSRLKLLTGGARDLPPRHRTLRQAIEWSYDLLNESEQRLFRYLGVFVSGFTAEAADTISEGRSDPSDSTLDLLLSLADKHLIREQKGTTGQLGATLPAHFRLLESVREYAFEQLDAHNETEETRRKHADYFLSLAEEAEQHFTGVQGPGWGAKQIEWVDRLEAELDNMRTALDWYQQEAETEIASQRDVLTDDYLPDLQKGLRLATALRRVWFGRDHSAEGLQRLIALLSLVPKPPPGESPRFLLAYAAALLVMGRLSADRVTAESVPVESFLKESLDIFIQLDDKQHRALALLNLGSVAMVREDLQSARHYASESLRLYRELGDKWGSAAALQLLGVTEWRDANIAQARLLLKESLVLFQDVGDYFGIAGIHESLGHMDYDQGDYSAAQDHWNQSLQEHRIGSRSGVGRLLVLLGWATLRQSNYEEARSLLAEGLAAAREWGTLPSIHWGLVGLAVLERLQNHTIESARIFANATAFLIARSLELAPADQSEFNTEMEATFNLLTGDALEEAWAEGYAMPLNEVLVIAAKQQV